MKKGIPKEKDMNNCLPECLLQKEINFRSFPQGVASRSFARSIIHGSRVVLGQISKEVFICTSIRLVSST